MLKIDIANVLNSIEMYELAINQGELDIANIQTLTVALYPKAIEYYSAFDNNMYNDLLNRMQSILQREDIQMVLSSAAGEGADPKAVDFNVTAEEAKKIQQDQKDLVAEVDEVIPENDKKELVADEPVEEEKVDPIDEPNKEDKPVEVAKEAESKVEESKELT